MLLCQRIERQHRFLFRQGKADDDVLTPELAPESLRRPFLRLGAARSFDLDEVPLRHGKRPEKKSEDLEICKSYLMLLTNSMSSRLKRGASSQNGE